MHCPKNTLDTVFNNFTTKFRSTIVVKKKLAIDITFVNNELFLFFISFQIHII